MVKGKVMSFRRSIKHLVMRHFVLDVGAATRKEAEKFKGKEVKWKSPAGKIITGKIASAHGNKGLVRAIFEKGLPGQSINTEVDVK